MTRIAQFHPELREHDAVSSEVAALHFLFARSGLTSAVFAERRSGCWLSLAEPSSTLASFAPSLVLIHYSLADPAHDRWAEDKTPKALLYHGITPAAWMGLANEGAFRGCLNAAGQIARLRPSIRAFFTHSSFTAVELHHLGVPGAAVMPYLPWQELYLVAPHQDTLASLSDKSRFCLLQVGSIMPHKRLEMSLLALRHLQSGSIGRWSLHIVGRDDAAPFYKSLLSAFVRQLMLQDVHFAGPVEQSVLNAYYRGAFAMLVTSVHEGFCVPVLEAFWADCPVVGFAAGALPETAGGAGVLLECAEPYLLARCLLTLAEKPDLRQRVIDRQRERLRGMAGPPVEAVWMNAIRELLEKG